MCWQVFTQVKTQSRFLKILGGQVTHSWKVVLVWICNRSRPFCAMSSFLSCPEWNTWLWYNKLFQISNYHISPVMGEYLEVCIAGWLLGSSWWLWLSAMLLLISCSIIPLLKESPNSFTLVRKGSLPYQLDGQLLWLGAIWIATLALSVGLVGAFIKWKLLMRWMTSFLVWKKINIHFIDCLCFYKSVYVHCSFYLFCFILQAVSTVFSTTSSWLFCLLLFKHVVHTYSTAKVQDSPCSLCRPG